MQDKIGLFDLDGSLADFEGAMISGLNAIKSYDDPTVTSLNIHKLCDVEPYRSRAKLIKASPDWWNLLKPITSGLEIFYLAQQIGFRNHVLTNGPKSNPDAWRQKVEWCQRYLGEGQDIHITSDKGLVYGRFLFDDYEKYVNSWLANRPRGVVIMPVYSLIDLPPEHDSRIHYYAGHSDISVIFRLLQRVYDRRDGESI